MGKVHLWYDERIACAAPGGSTSPFPKDVTCARCRAQAKKIESGDLSCLCGHWHFGPCLLCRGKHEQRMITARIAVALGLPADATLEDCEMKARELAGYAKHTRACKHRWTQEELDAATGEIRERRNLIDEVMGSMDEGSRVHDLERVAAAAEQLRACVVVDYDGKPESFFGDARGALDALNVAFTKLRSST